MTLPVLYTFRRCPYAMRARMALSYAGINFIVREVVLKDKPKQLIEASTKATVPVLLLPDSSANKSTLDESLDILHWAIAQNDPDGWLDYPAEILEDMAQLVRTCDEEFKTQLDHYKYADRFPEDTPENYRANAENFLTALESRLAEQTGTNPMLFSNALSYADIAILPFIRQFANVDIKWFETAPYPRLQSWLNRLLASELFIGVMKKYPKWAAEQSPLYFQSEAE